MILLKTQKTNFNRIKLNKKSFIFLLTTLFLTFVVYSISLSRGWQPFDERLFYKEILFPIPEFFGEIKEIIKNFVLNCHIESSNSFFSNHETIRGAPFAWVIYTFFSYFLKKNAFCYHFLSVFIHLVNTALIWLIFYLTLYNFFEKKEVNYLTLLIISIFSLLFSLHSANTEAVLLATNWNALLCFTLCFLLLVLEFVELNDLSGKITKLKFTLKVVIYFLALELVEQVYTFFAIVFFLVFSFAYRKLHSYKEITILSLKHTSPYLFGIILYLLFSFMSTFSPTENLKLSNIHLNDTYKLNFLNYTFLERNLWLTPQIFVHALVILFFPKTLSLYQSNLVKLSNSLFDPYSVLCTLIYVLFITIPLIILFKSKNKILKSCFLLFYPFYFSLIPFLHVVVPTYCLFADRYCYFPSFFLVFLLLNFVFLVLKNKSLKLIKPLLLLLAIFLIAITTRTLYRITDWSTPEKFYLSAIKKEHNPLNKAQKRNVYASFLKDSGKTRKAKELAWQALNELEKEIKRLKNLQNSNKTEPITLKIYGLDTYSLLLKASYLSLVIHYYYFGEEIDKSVSFYESLLKGNENFVSSEQLGFYASYLIKNKKYDSAIKVLEIGLKRFPYSSFLLNTLGEHYLENKDPIKAYPIIFRAYKLFPNNVKTLNNLYNYYNLMGDKINQGEVAYLLGLRNHDPISYQNALQTYLDVKKIKEAKITLEKLVRLEGETPLNLLLASKYFDLTGNREKILPLLIKAHNLSKLKGKTTDIKITKSILASLININIFLGKHEDAKRYLGEFESLGNINFEDKRIISELKSKI